VLVRMVFSIGRKYEEKRDDAQRIDDHR